MNSARQGTRLIRFDGCMVSTSSGKAVRLRGSRAVVSITLKHTDVRASEIHFDE